MIKTQHPSVKVRAMKLIMGRRIVAEALNSFPVFADNLDDLVKNVASKLEAAEISFDDLQEFYDKGEEGDHRIGRLMDDILLKVKLEFMGIRDVKFQTI